MLNETQLQVIPFKKQTNEQTNPPANIAAARGLQNRM